MLMDSINSQIPVDYIFDDFLKFNGNFEWTFLWQKSNCFNFHDFFVLVIPTVRTNMMRPLDIMTLGALTYRGIAQVVMRPPHSPFGF